MIIIINDDMLKTLHTRDRKRKLPVCSVVSKLKDFSRSLQAVT